MSLARYKERLLAVVDEHRRGLLTDDELVERTAFLALECLVEV